MLIRSDLLRQLVLLNRPRITRRLRRPVSVVANLVFEFIWQSVNPLPVDLPEKTWESRKANPFFRKYFSLLALLHSFKANLHCEHAVLIGAIAQDG